MKTRSIVAPLAVLAAVFGVTGCETLGGEDKVGQTSKEVDATLEEHDANPGAHDNMTIDAAQLTTGTLADARLSDELTGAIAKNTTDIASHAVVLGEHASRLTSAESDLADASGRLDAVEVAIPQRVARTGDTMTGTLQLPALVYTAAKTKVVGVSPWGFAPENSNTTWDGFAFSGNNFRAITGGTLAMAAPVVFPDGAHLTGMSVRVYDTSVTGDVRIGLRRFDGFSYTDIGETGSTAADVGGATTFSTTLNHNVANTGEQLYWLYWTQSLAGTRYGGPGLYGVRITYTYTQP